MKTCQSSVKGLPELGSNSTRDAPVSKKIPFAHPIRSFRKDRYALIARLDGSMLHRFLGQCVLAVLDAQEFPIGEFTLPDFSSGGGYNRAVSQRVFYH